ncbi:MAG: Thiosulfate sulfurtransferase [Candidatus Solibacter sp.]|nr:Thiosulfate sulfurtransferase [Candidatus Solibacter sp.]
MKRNVTGLLLGCLMAAYSAGAATCGGHGDRATMLVSTDWLAQHLNDKNLVIVAIGQPADYHSHIPGAVQLAMDEVSTPMEMGKLMLELPPVEQLHKTFAGLGITNDSRVVLYVGNASVQSMTRVYLTLDAMGLGARTAILNGGMKTWKAENRPVSSDVPTVKPGTLDLCPQSDVIATLDYVNGNMKHAGVRILDARAEQFYTGKTAGKTHDGQDQRKGHIPGAGNLQFSSLFDNQGKFHSAEQLKTQFAEAGVKSGDRVVSYCHIGQQATVVYFAARYLGYDARMYDGSWDEWNVHTELPVEVSK